MVLSLRSTSFGREDVLKIGCEMAEEFTKFALQTV